MASFLWFVPAGGWTSSRVQGCRPETKGVSGTLIFFAVVALMLILGGEREFQAVLAFAGRGAWLYCPQINMEPRWAPFERMVGYNYRVLFGSHEQSKCEDYAAHTNLRRTFLYAAVPKRHPSILRALYIVCTYANTETMYRDTDIWM